MPSFQQRDQQVNPIKHNKKEKKNCNKQTLTTSFTLLHIPPPTSSSNSSSLEYLSLV